MQVAYGYNLHLFALKRYPTFSENMNLEEENVRARYLRFIYCFE